MKGRVPVAVVLMAVGGAEEGEEEEGEEEEAKEQAKRNKSSGINSK